MKCENCEEIHDGNYGSGRFCSIKCSKSFSTKNNRKSISEKVSNTLKGRKSIFKGTGENYLCVEDRICKKCEIKFTSKRKLQKYCSQTCARSHKTDETKEILRQKALENVKNGKHKGWKTRNIESYPEKFFKKVLIENNIVFEFNKPIKKRDIGIDCDSNYFLDFYLPEYNIDLEIDGKQHYYEDRKQHDIIRDYHLSKIYKIYRIQWLSINNEQGKIYIQNEIDKFIKYINNKN